MMRTLAAGEFLNRSRDLITRAFRSDFTSKVGETLLTKIFMVLFGVAASVLVARALGPYGRGLVATAGAVTSIGIQFGNLGFPATNVYYVAKDKSLATALFGNSLVLGLAVVGGVCVGLGLLFALFPSVAPVGNPLLLIALAGIPFGITVLLLESLLLGLQDVRAYNGIELVMKVLAVGVTLALVLASRATPESIVGVGVLASLVGLVWTVSRLRSHHLGTPRPSAAVVRGQLRFGLKAYASTLFAFIVLRFDLLMVNAALGAEQTGYYSVAVTMVDLLYMFPAVVGSILMPRLSELDDGVAKWRAAKQVAWIVGVAMVGLAVLSAALASPAVRILFGVSFLPSVEAFWWLLPGVVALGANTILMTLFASSGMPWVTVYSPLLASVVNVILNLLLIPVLGIVGASVASSVAYAGMLATSVEYLARTRRRGEPRVE